MGEAAGATFVSSDLITSLREVAYQMSVWPGHEYSTFVGRAIQYFVAESRSLGPLPWHIGFSRDCRG